MLRNLFCILLLTYLFAEPADSAEYAPSKPHYWRLWDDTNDILDIITSIKGNKLDGQKANPEKGKIFLCKCENEIYICIADANNVWKYHKILDSKKGLKIDNLQESDAKQSADSFNEFVSEKGYVERSEDVIQISHALIDNPAKIIADLRTQNKGWNKGSYYILNHNIFIKAVNEYYAAYAKFDANNASLIVTKNKEDSSITAWEKFISDRVRILDKKACERYLSEHIVRPLKPEINLEIDDLDKPKNLYHVPYSKDVVTLYKADYEYVRFTNGLQDVQTNYSATDGLLEIMTVRDDAGNKITPDRLSDSWGDKGLLISGMRYFYFDKSKNACYPIRVQDQFKGKVSRVNPDLNQFQLCSDKQNSVLADDFVECAGWKAFSTSFKDKEGFKIDLKKLIEKSKIPLLKSGRSIDEAILADCRREIDFNNKAMMELILEDRGIIQVDGKFIRIFGEFQTQEVNLLDELVELAADNAPDQDARFLNLDSFDQKNTIQRIEALHNLFILRQGENTQTKSIAFIQAKNDITRWDSSHNPGSLESKQGDKFYHLDSNTWKLADCTLRIDPRKPDSCKLLIENLFDNLEFECEGEPMKCFNKMDAVIGYLNKTKGTTEGQLNTCEFDSLRLRYKVIALEGSNTVKCERVLRSITTGK